MSKIKMCLASKYNNCSGGISGEHYISKSILNLSSIDDKVEICGLPWIKPNTFEKIGINSLTANILCTKHNNDLSIYDNEILKLYKAFAEIDNHFNKSCFLDVNEIKIDGNKIEKWMLKTCLGLIASKQISKNDKREELVIKDFYLDILFNDKKISDNCGLYFKIPKNRWISKHNGFSFIPQTANCELKAAEFWINNFAFNFIIEKPNIPNEVDIYRINKITFKTANDIKSIILDWDNNIYNRSIEMLLSIKSES